MAGAFFRPKPLMGNFYCLICYYYLPLALHLYKGEISPGVKINGHFSIKIYQSDTEDFSLSPLWACKGEKFFGIFLSVANREFEQLKRVLNNMFFYKIAKQDHFGKIKNLAEAPDLLEVQIQSF